MGGAFVCCNGGLASICADCGGFIHTLERTYVEAASNAEISNPPMCLRPAAMPRRVASNDHGVVYLFELVSRDVDDQASLLKPSVRPPPRRLIAVLAFAAHVLKLAESSFAEISTQQVRCVTAAPLRKVCQGYASVSARYHLKCASECGCARADRGRRATHH